MLKRSIWLTLLLGFAFACKPKASTASLQSLEQLAGDKDLYRSCKGPESETTSSSFLDLMVRVKGQPTQAEDQAIADALTAVPATIRGGFLGPKKQAEIFLTDDPVVFCRETFSQDLQSVWKYLNVDGCWYFRPGGNGQDAYAVIYVTRDLKKLSHALVEQFALFWSQHMTKVTLAASGNTIALTYQPSDAPGYLRLKKQLANAFLADLAAPGSFYNLRSLEYLTGAFSPQIIQDLKSGKMVIDQLPAFATRGPPSRNSQGQKVLDFIAGHAAHSYYCNNVAPANSEAEGLQAAGNRAGVKALFANLKNSRQAMRLAFPRAERAFAAIDTFVFGHKAANARVPAKQGFGLTDQGDDDCRDTGDFADAERAMANPADAGIQDEGPAGQIGSGAAIAANDFGTDGLIAAGATTDQLALSEQYRTDELGQDWLGVGGMYEGASNDSERREGLALAGVPGFLKKLCTGGKQAEKDVQAAQGAEAAVTKNANGARSDFVTGSVRAAREAKEAADAAKAVNAARNAAKAGIKTDFDTAKVFSGGDVKGLSAGVDAELEELGIKNASGGAKELELPGLLKARLGQIAKEGDPGQRANQIAQVEEQIATLPSEAQPIALAKLNAAKDGGEPVNKTFEDLYPGLQKKPLRANGSASQAQPIPVNPNTPVRPQLTPDEEIAKLTGKSVDEVRAQRGVTQVDVQLPVGASEDLKNAAAAAKLVDPAKLDALADKVLSAYGGRKGDGIASNLLLGKKVEPLDAVPKEYKDFADHLYNIRQLLANPSTAELGRKYKSAVDRAFGLP